MRRGGSSIAIYLCLLLVLNEFGSAHFRKLANKKKKSDRQHGHKRGAITSLGKLVFKAMEITAKYTSDISTLANIAATVYADIRECKDTEYGQEAEAYTNQSTAIAKKIEKEIIQLNITQLMTQNLQVRVDIMNYHFNETLKAMQEAGQSSDLFLQAVNPDIIKALRDKTIELEAELVKAQETQTQKDYVTISKTYYTRTEKVIKLAVPFFVTLIPRIPKILEFGQARIATLKSFELVEKFSSVIKKPNINTAPYRKMKSWFAKPVQYLSRAKNALRGKVKFSYEKAVKYAKNFGKGFTVLSGFVNTAFNIYSVFDTLNQCKTKRDEAFKALQEMQKAEQSFEEVKNNTAQAEQEMNDIKDKVIEQFSSDFFLEDLTNMRENMREIQGDGTGMVGMISAIDNYLQGIPGNTNADEVEPLLRELYEQSIGSLKFVYNCLRYRSLLIGNVARQCQEGENTLSELIENEKLLQVYETDECLRVTGIPFFDTEALTGMIDEVSVSQDFNKECKMNRKGVQQDICDKMCEDKNPAVIAKDLGLSVNAVEGSLSDCSLPCQIRGQHKRTVCGAKKNGFSTQKIFDFMFAPLPERLGYTLQMVEELDCSDEN